MQYKKKWKWSTLVSVKKCLFPNGSNQKHSWVIRSIEIWSYQKWCDAIDDDHIDHLYGDWESLKKVSWFVFILIGLTLNLNQGQGLSKWNPLWLSIVLLFFSHIENESHRGIT